MNDPLHLFVPAHKRVDAARFGLLIEIGGKGLQGTGGRRLRGLPRFLGLLSLVGPGFIVRHLGDSVGDVIDDIDAGDVLELQEIHRLALLLAEDRHQHIGPRDFLAPGGLHVKHRSLEHALEPQGGLSFPFLCVLR